MRRRRKAAPLGGRGAFGARGRIAQEGARAGRACAMRRSPALRVRGTKLCAVRGMVAAESALGGGPHGGGSGRARPFLVP
jgi:hypothetical protein